MSASPTAVILSLPNYHIPAPWPLPYAPLTTIFTPPSQCNDKWTLVSESTDPKTTTIGQFVNLLDTHDDATCLPSGYGSDVWSATFSPGVYCPSGYAIAATGTEVYTAVWEKGLPFPADERRLVCCLSGFGYTIRGNKDVCVSSYDHSTSALTRDFLTESNQYMYTKATQVGPGIAIGHPIHLRHNDAEFKSLFTGIPTESASSSSGLSTGAIAGIAAGCGVVGLVLLGLGIWFILRHRKRKQNSSAQQPKSDEGSIEMAYPDPSTPPVGGWRSKETATAATATAAPGWDAYEQDPQVAETSSKKSSKKKSSRSKRDRSERGERSDRHERSGRSRHHAS